MPEPALPALPASAAERAAVLEVWAVQIVRQLGPATALLLAALLDEAAADVRR